MARYKLIENGVVELDENLTIPNDARNRHWNQFQLWLAEGNTPDPIQSFAEHQQEMLDAVKVDTGKIITDQLPEYKQRNMIARALELTRIETPTVDDIAEMDDIQSMWDWVKLVREQSNVVEANIMQHSTKDELDKAFLPIRMSEVEGI